MLIRGDAHAADPFLGRPGGMFLGVKIKVIFALSVGKLGPASSAQLGLRFSLLDTSTYLGFWKGLEASYVWCQEGNWGPKQAP